MKISRSLIWIAATMLLACTRQGADEPGALVLQTISASAGDAVKTVVSGSSVLWSPNEKVNVFVEGASYTFTSNKSTESSSTTFNGYAPADIGTYYMLSPYNSSASMDVDDNIHTSLPTLQTGRDNTFDDGILILAGQSSTSSVNCKHVCSGIRFIPGRADITAVTLRGMLGEDISGSFRFYFDVSGDPVALDGTEEVITLTAPGGGTFKADKYYYIVTLPSDFGGGFTLTAYAGSKRGTMTKYSTLYRGQFKNLTNTLAADTDMEWADVPSVYYGPQNSFCVAPGGSVNIDVSPKKISGLWQRSGESASAPAPNGYQVLWGDATASLTGTTLSVTADAAGSSLVAIKNGDTILWSYLIWATGSKPEDVALGGNCYFQWGRKDPLQTTASRTANKGIGGLAYSIANPTIYIQGEVSACDWFCNDQSLQDASLWGAGGQKTVWDPCPEGYRVPSEAYYTDAGIDYGYLISNFLKLGYIADNGYHESRTYWTCTPSSSYSCALDDSRNPDVFFGQTRDIAAPVRCVKE